MALNKDQESALHTITKIWWKSNEIFMVLDGAGGTGKSYLVDSVLSTLNCTPLLLAPTNEALKQLKDKVKGKYDFKTVHSALGIIPSKTEKDLKFEQVKLPNFWEEYNLCIIDEVSMLDDFLLDILLDIGIKILFVGHSSQLPPVTQRRLSTDKCISPVFTKNFRTITLKQPMRNTGELWEFNNYLDSIIYSAITFVPDTFDITKADLMTLLNTSVDDFLTDKTKIALWTNDGVNVYNQKVRKIIHGEKARSEKFLPKDRIILTTPLNLIHNLEAKKQYDLFKSFDSKVEVDTLFTNSKGTVVGSTRVVVKINSTLVIPCFKLSVRFDDSPENVLDIYTCEDEKDRNSIAIYYEHQAWTIKNSVERGRAFQRRRFMLGCFGDIKHFYACTSHRLQGSSVPNIIVIDSDIRKNSNIIEQKKTRYVACSRAINNLYFFRGIL